MKNRQLWSYLVATLALMPIAAIAEIGSMKVDHYCSFNDKPLPSIIATFDSDDAAQQALKRVMRYTGLPPRFEILAADVPNAAAVIRNNKRYILYSQQFMRKVRDTTRNNWSEISVLAHEIGHHLSNHTFGSTGSRPKFELEADRFSGFVLQKMGASLDDAVAVTKRMVSQQGSKTHPPRSARIAAVTNGWMDAEEKSGGNRFAREPANKANAKHSHNGRQHVHPLPADGLNHQHGGGQAQSVSANSTTPTRVSQPSKATIQRGGNKGPAMISVRGGSFIMGSPETEGGRISSIEKQRRVQVGNFSIGKYEVTNKEYMLCVSAGSCTRPQYHRNTNIIANHPVSYISWFDAITYTEWLSRKTGQKYRLPTEAEWEYAARAGSTTAYSWGNGFSPRKANCQGCDTKHTSSEKTPVGSFPANNWGIHDMAGNVSEWTCSAFHNKYNGAETQCDDGSANTPNRAVRGGNNNSNVSAMRSAHRDSHGHQGHEPGIGFRLVRVP